MFLAGIEPATFRVWGERDNHYTTETIGSKRPHSFYNVSVYFASVCDVLWSAG